MAIKLKSSGKSKSAVKSKSVIKKTLKVKPYKKSISKQDDLSQLSKDIISNIGVGIYIVQHGKFIFTSPLYQRLTGYSATEIIGHNSLDHVHPDDKAMVRTKATKSLKEKSHSYEYRFIRKNGEEMWILEMVTSIIYKGEYAALGSFMDIAERKQAEKDLLREKKFSDAVVNSSPGLLFVFDDKGNIIQSNRNAEKVTGYSTKEISKMNILDFVAKEDQKTAAEAMQEVLTKGRSSVEITILSKPGKKTPFYIIGLRTKFENTTCVVCTGSDITEHKQAEKALRESEVRYRTLFQATSDSILIADLETKIFRYANPAACRLLGYSETELTTIGVAAIHPKADLPRVMAEFEALVRGDKKLAADLPCLRKDGTIVYADITAGVMTIDGRVCLVGFFRDITERKVAEEKLLQSEKRYRTIIETIQDGYFETDLTGKFTFLNDAECNNLEYTREELIEMAPAAYADEKNRKLLTNLFIEIYKTGIPVKAYNLEFTKKDGTKAYNEMSVSLIRNSKGESIGFRGISRDVTERKQYEEELALLRAAMDVSKDMVFLVDRTTMRFLYVNDAARRLTGYTREDFMKMLPHEMLGVDRKTLEHAYDEAIAAAPAGVIVEMKNRTKDGTRTITELHRNALHFGNRWVITTNMHDISRRWLAEESMRLLGRMFAALSATNEAILHAKSPEELYQRVCDAAVDGGKFINTGVLLFDPGTTWVRVAAASGADTDKLREARISLDEAIPEGRGLVGTAFRTGKPCVSNDYLKDPVSMAWREGTKKVGSGAVVPLLREGQIIGALIFSAAEKRAFDDEIIKLLERMAENVVFALDNFEREAERKHAEEKVQYLATHDALTGLPNRLLFSQLLNHAIQSAKRYKRQLATFFIDLDRFKIINDTLGHRAGDQLLQEIALRFKQSLRAADVVGRLGGDEFVILIEEINDLEQAATVAHKILATAIKPMVLLGEECRITASIGISIYPKDGEDEQALMKNADIAMYLAKEEGKNNFQFYSEDIQTKSIERLSIETNLRFALEHNELALHYQAKVDFKTNAITGVEALLRWQNPSLGSVTPTQFIPVAEESGLIIPIGRWVMKTACAQNVAWQRDGLPPVCMAVNLSLRQLMDEFLMEDIKKALNDSGMAPNLLELEITESMVMHNPPRVIAVLTKIKNLGVRLAIDDFGTGYSSLGQIKHFPIDTLKVDRSFIRNVPQDSEDKAITEAIIAMGKTLSLTVVAEGVETVEQMNFLKDHSCDEMQGFYFSKPIAPDQFADLLRNHVPSLKKSRPTEG